MESEWPFTARRSELESLASGAVAVGEAGAGKSRLLREAARRAGGGLVTVAAEPSVPFGAFAHLLPPDVPANPLRWAAEILGDAAALLIVDDAHLLDSWSAALIHHLVVHHGTRLLAAVRAGALPDALSSLWRDGLIKRLDLLPLNQHQVTEVLTAALGGRVEGATARRLWHATRGNVRFLRELVASGRASGSLELRAGMWRWQGDLSMSSRFAMLIESFMGPLNDAEREVVELVAFGEPLDAAVVAAESSRAAAKRLERRGVIVSGGSGTSVWVRLAHPLYGEVVRRRAGVLTVRGYLGALPRPRSGLQPGRPDLTTREREIAQLASWGLSNREIAECLVLSHRTVANHLCRIYQKLGVADRGALCA
ncbi:LuxR C-terminal-related transcriptional regulator [Nonomuraea sp. 10N515B]|uniref:LuxR C-terminal-related transcriptional regulator n=1 Tax=Nonomuraea sp. 10N515B TaxID=3457422 RepID=UPI003FCC9D0C